MMPGMNPRKMAQMMKKMGVNQQEIDAEQVIIKCKDKEIIITNPQVAKVKMMGNESWQITGDVHEQSLSTTPDISKEDIQTVMDQCSCDEATAKAAIEKHDGDLAAAIMGLSEEKE